MLQLMVVVEIHSRQDRRLWVATSSRDLFFFSNINWFLEVQRYQQTQVKTFVAIPEGGKQMKLREATTNCTKESKVAR